MLQSALEFSTYPPPHAGRHAPLASAIPLSRFRARIPPHPLAAPQHSRPSLSGRTTTGMMSLPCRRTPTALQAQSGRATMGTSQLHKEQAISTASAPEHSMPSRQPTGWTSIPTAQRDRTSSALPLLMAPTAPEAPSINRSRQVSRLLGPIQPLASLAALPLAAMRDATTAGQTIANQTWTVNGYTLSSDVKGISYQCNKILVNGQ